MALPARSASAAAAFADAFQPGHLAGSLTQLQLVGPGSPNPGQGLYNNDWNNFAPAIGVSYAPDTKTVLRAGYFIVYDRNSLRNADTEVGSNPGINSTLTFTSGNLLNLSNVGVPFAPAGLPLATVPLTDRLQTLRLYDTNLVTPYVQNWNLSVQREIAKDSVLTVRYVGTKGTKMLSGVDLNQGNILPTASWMRSRSRAPAATLRCSTSSSPASPFPARAWWTA